jgi:hypothetical protein
MPSSSHPPPYCNNQRLPRGQGQKHIPVEQSQQGAAQVKASQCQQPTRSAVRSGPAWMHSCARACMPHAWWVVLFLVRFLERLLGRSPRPPQGGVLTSGSPSGPGSQPPVAAGWRHPYIRFGCRAKAGPCTVAQHTAGGTTGGRRTPPVVAGGGKSDGGDGSGQPCSSQIAI